MSQTKKRIADIPKMKSTNNHGIFKLATNRPVNEKRVEKLKEAMEVEDLGHLFPIVVDDENIIRDGQHRFTARKKLGLPIYYIVSDVEMDIGTV